MKFTTRGLALVAVVGVFVATAWGDGKFFVVEKVPRRSRTSGRFSSSPITQRS
jgi:hypothetical protein